MSAPEGRVTFPDGSVATTVVTYVVQEERGSAVAAAAYGKWRDLHIGLDPVEVTERRDRWAADAPDVLRVIKRTTTTTVSEEEYPS